MATYAISDIHGCYDQFMELLNKISPTDTDKIYILGDIADRGPKSAKMFQWAIDEAPDSFHFMLGNHELMILENVRDDDLDYHEVWFSTWSYNGGLDTLDQLEEEVEEDWIKQRFIPWLRKLRPWTEVIINDEPILLVHAGFSLRKLFPESKVFPDIWPKYKTEKIPHGFGPQDDMTMTWIRKGWYNTEETLPVKVICGHTPTNLLQEMAHDTQDRCKRMNMPIPEWSKTVPNAKIWHYKNKINIDCGCAYGGNLAALRLDDFKEFYVEGLKKE